MQRRQALPPPGTCNFRPIDSMRRTKE
jgi:hypothetical protein